MQIETERLILRRPVPEDLETFEAVFANDDMWLYSFTRRGLTHAETREWFDRQLLRWAEEGWGHFALILKQTNALIGYCGLAIPNFLPEILPAVEIGYRILPEHWGKGLVTEAAAATLRFGFTQAGLDRVVALYEPENIGSGRVMQKIGMRYVKDSVIPEGATPIRVYEMTREEWADRTERNQFAGRPRNQDAEREYSEDV